MGNSTVDVAGAAHAGAVRAARDTDLDGERADAAGRPDDEQPLARPDGGERK
ncbi:hypothetical protein V1Y59_18625 [Gordonia sp. PKS22-38]|uniref:Uncharacterized protein n=1 Tax=Gordonia prachuapensis TaxID=3115651 RepID=A0ABU7MY82_9ACTN|nr:hypothetical protein [Gordonia sp. PKS22-38]